MYVPEPYTPLHVRTLAVHVHFDLAEREFIFVQFLDVKISSGRGSRGAVDGVIAAKRRSARVVGADFGALGVCGGVECSTGTRSSLRQ